MMLKTLLYRIVSSSSNAGIVATATAARKLSSNQRASVHSPPIQGPVLNLVNKKSSLELVIAKTEGTRVLSFNPHWLRFNCHSELSKQPGTGQMIIDADSVPPSLTIDQVELNGADLVIKWNKEAGQSDSVLPVEFLINNYPSEINKSPQSRFKTSKVLRDFEYASFFGKDGTKNQDAIFEWIKCIAEHGLCLLKGVPTETNMVKSVAELIAPVQQTIYDEVFDVKAEKNPINIAYSDVPLGFHMDLMYYESSPGLQFLHCLKFDEQIEGGSSLFVDTFQVADDFRAQHPGLFRHLVRIPATFQKIHMNRKRPVCMVYQRPHIVVNNQDQVIAVNWAPPFEGPLRGLSQDDIKSYYESYIVFSRFLNSHPSVIKHRLRPGEMACFNNRRVLHARDGFKSNNGERHLQGCYVNIDEFKSEALVQEYYSLVRSGKIKPSESEKIDPRALSLQSVVYGNHDYN